MQAQMFVGNYLRHINPPGRKECSLVPHPPPLEDVNLLGYVSNKPRQPINHDLAESSLLVASVLGILAHSLTSGSPFGLQSPTDAKIRVGGKKRKKWSSPPSQLSLSLSLSLSLRARARLAFAPFARVGPSHHRRHRFGALALAPQSESKSHQK